MPKKIETLVKDIYEVVSTRGGWDATITQFMSEGMSDLLRYRFEEEEAERGGTLRMSNMGTPCKRKLWYHLHAPHTGEPLPPQAYLKFFYGDILELLVLSLAKAAGHDVAGMQDELSIGGIVGHRDAVIDGITVDVKSASPYSFLKFKDGLVPDSDPFGYLSQLSSYVYAGHRAEGPDRVHPNRGAFLVIQKVSGEICLDQHWFESEVENKEQEFLDTIQLTSDPDNPPARGFEPVNDGYYNSKKKEFVPNGNKVLSLNCSYCEFKHECHPGLRTFMYRKGQSSEPKFFTKVVKEPKVDEVK
jgi:hypothetical protein